MDGRKYGVVASILHPGATLSSFSTRHADNYLVDVKFEVIVDVEASRAIRQAEAVRRRR